LIAARASSLPGRLRARAFLRAAVLVIAATCASGCGSGYGEAAPVHIKRDPAHPSIVSLNPCTDAILVEVTEPGQLLAISDYSQKRASSSMDLAVARRFRAVSGTVEEVSVLAPQVVVAGAYLAPATANAFRTLGFEVVMMPIASDLDAAREQVRQLARVAGHPERGDRLIARIDGAVARAAPPAGFTPIPALVWQSGGLVAGDDTLIVDMMERAGFINAAGARGLSQADFLPLERVLADPPQVIFAGGISPAEEDRMLDHPALSSLADMKRVPLDRSLLWCGGPTIPRALNRLAKARRELTRASTAQTSGIPPNAARP
jgi:iron complex transport system substrate-binding protein